MDIHYSLTNNTSLSFSPGSFTRGVAKPHFLTSPGAVRTNTLLVSIADITVFLRALSSGTRGAYPGFVAFPDAILASLEPLPISPPTWNAILKLHLDSNLHPTYPTNLSLTFSAHREPILST